MKRTRTFGIAVVTALALTAFVGVSSASAASAFQAPGAGAGTTTLNGTRVGLANHQLKLGDDLFNCSGVEFTGTMSGESVPSVSVTPHLDPCTWQGVLTVGFSGSCKYRLNPGPGSESQTVGTIDLVGCEGPLKLNAYGCLIEIGNQNGVGSVEYKNVGSTIEAKATLNSITYTRFGSCVGKAGTFSDGTYSGSWIVKGTRSGKEVPVKVFGTAAPAPTKFVAEEAPVTLAGTDSVENYKSRIAPLGGNGLYCKSYSLSGTSASASSETLTLTPTYKGCKVNSEVVPDGNVSMGGCSYVFHADGKLDIAGATCASNPITITRAGCIATVGPQSGLSGFSFQNEGSGKLRTISISGGVYEQIAVTRTGPNCTGEGTVTTGAMQSGIKLTATNSGGKQQGISVE